MSEKSVVLGLLGVGVGWYCKFGTHVGRRSWQKETRLRNMFWSVGCSGIGLREGMGWRQTEAIN